MFEINLKKKKKHQKSNEHVLNSKSEYLISNTDTRDTEKSGAFSVYVTIEFHIFLLFSASIKSFRKI